MESKAKVKETKAKETKAKEAENKTTQLKNAAESCNVEFKGLMVKKARIKNENGKEKSDILGWDYIFRAIDGTCYSFYAAEPPLIGMTQPIPIICPLGVKAFNSYKVDFKQAIETLHTMKCGGTFVAMSLSWPLTPECKQPYWHIRTSIGNDVAIGENTGKSICSKI